MTTVFDRRRGTAGRPLAHQPGRLTRPIPVPARLLALQLTAVYRASTPPCRFLSWTLSRFGGPRPSAIGPCVRKFPTSYYRPSLTDNTGRPRYTGTMLDSVPVCTVPTPDLPVGQSARLPDPARCRAVPITPGSEVAWCLTATTGVCTFRQCFADRHLCCHPDRRLIIARTAGQPPIPAVPPESRSTS